MGFMTEISILNDDWDRFERMVREEPEKLLAELRVLQHGRPEHRHDPATGERKYIGSLESDQVRGPHVTVYRSHHADDPRVYVAYRNSFQAIDKFIVEHEYEDRLDTDLILNYLDRMAELAEERGKELRQLVQGRRAGRKP